jgi:peroxiredoxin
MKLLLTCLLLIAANLVGAGFNTALASDSSPFASRALRTIHQSDWHRDPQARFHVVYFLGVECPVARLYATRIESLAKEWNAKGIQFVIVASNIHDSEKDLQQCAKDLQLSVPILRDSDQSIAKSFAITRTSEVVVIDPKIQVRYRGRIDDQFAPGQKKSSASSHELKRALEELTESNTISVAETKPVGCLITYQPSAPKAVTTTYAEHIAPIFYRHCIDCHRPGEIGPFDMTKPEELPGWGNMIVEVMEQKRMPPWHATPEHLEFKNARSVLSEEMELVKKWVADGAPMGNLERLPPIPKAISGWRLDREPDLVVAMRNAPYAVPAQGTIDYQYFVVDPRLTEDRWITAAQVIPGDASVVHHAIVFIRPPDDQNFQGIGWLTAFVPGQRATQFPSRYARRVPAGSKLIFQMHYTPNGTATSDLTRIGMNFVDESQVTHEVFTLVGINQEFEIPPHRADHAVHATLSSLPRDSELLAIMPHMHLRGRSFELFAKRSESQQTLLNVPRYDFNWQHTYELKRPLPLADVEQLCFTATFDNSADNPFNPSPSEFVMWGDQTWEEMAVAFFEVAQERTASTENHRNRVPTRRLGAMTNRSAKTPEKPRDVPDTGPSNTSASHAAFADDFLSRYDSNRDDSVAFSEVPRIVQDYVYYRLDLDRNGAVTRDELIAVAKGRSAK